MKLFKKNFVIKDIEPGDLIEITNNSGLYKVLEVHEGTMLLRSKKSGEQRLYFLTTYKRTYVPKSKASQVSVS